MQLAELGLKSWAERRWHGRAGNQDLTRDFKEQDRGDTFASQAPTASSASYTTGEPIRFPSKAETARFNRIAYAAAHVVADPLADNDPWVDTNVDWDKTIAFRHYLWDLGLGVAEAMDTAQRGGGLDWSGAQTSDQARARGRQSRGRARKSVAASAPIISSRAPMSPSTTSSAPMKSRSKRSRRWAASSS